MVTADPLPGGVLGLADLLVVAAAESPEKLALVEAGGRSITWAALDLEVSRIAAGLGPAGIVGGHRVVLAVPNRIEFVSTYLGVLRAQAIAVPVNPRSSIEELARILVDSGARMVVADSATVRSVRAAVAAVADEDYPAYRAPRIVVIGTTLQPGERSYDHLRTALGRSEPPPLTDPERVATLLYTSGTSGRPRAAMLSHRALLADVVAVAAVQPPMIHGDDVVLGVVPLSHVYGLNAVLGGVLRQRAKLVLVDRFDPEGVLDLVEDEACSVLPLAPAVFAHWSGREHLRERLGPVRLVLSGSAPLDPQVRADFTAVTGIAVHQGYGLTETASVVTSTLCSTPGSTGAGRGSVGAAVPGVRLRLLDDGAAPGEQDAGEIQVAGDLLFSGYWPDGADAPDVDGWWSTGDVGYLDDTGDLFLVDRVKELVIVSGFNVYPVEVEEVIRDLDGVLDAAVVGTPDPMTGEAVVAYVVASAPGADADAIARSVTAHCVDRLAGFKRPSRVEVVDALPRTLTGKVQKGRLRGLERRRTSGVLE